MRPLVSANSNDKVFSSPAHYSLALSGSGNAINIIVNIIITTNRNTESTPFHCFDCHMQNGSLR